MCLLTHVPSPCACLPTPRLQVFNSKSPPGVIRSPQRPEETRGPTRSGALVVVLHAHAKRLLGHGML